jgi:hypothetical protein
VLRRDDELQRAADRNQRAALAAALLLQPGEFDDRQLFHSLCGLSYQGDVRLQVVEARKVHDIVGAQARSICCARLG